MTELELKEFVDDPKNDAGAIWSQVQNFVAQEIDVGIQPKQAEIDETKAQVAAVIAKLNDPGSAKEDALAELAKTENERKRAELQKEIQVKQAELDSL